MPDKLCWRNLRIRQLSSPRRSSRMCVIDLSGRSYRAVVTSASFYTTQLREAFHIELGELPGNQGLGSLRTVRGTVRSLKVGCDMASRSSIGSSSSGRLPLNRAHPCFELMIGDGQGKLSLAFNLPGEHKHRIYGLARTLCLRVRVARLTAGCRISFQATN